MKNRSYFFIIIVISLSIVLSCGKSDDKSKTETNQQDSQIDKSKLVSVEIKTKGMTCTGCEENIKTEIKKLNGIQEVKADHKSNTAKIIFDSGQTDIKSLEEAISAAGYKVLEVKEQQ